MKHSEEILFDDLSFNEDAELSEIDLSALLEFPALNQPKDIDPPKGENYVVFQLDERFYGIPAKSVSEITSSLPITTLPGVPAWFVGIANLRGDLISVVDLRKLWNMPGQTPLKTRFILFRSPKNDSTIAFVVDKFNDLTSIAAKDVNFSAEDFTNSTPFVFGKADFKSHPLLMLDIENVLSSLQISPTKLV